VRHPVSRTSKVSVRGDANLLSGLGKGQHSPASTIGRVTGPNRMSPNRKTTTMSRLYASIHSPYARLAERRDTGSTDTTTAHSMTHRRASHAASCKPTPAHVAHCEAGCRKAIQLEWHRGLFEGKGRFHLCESMSCSLRLSLSLSLSHLERPSPPWA
jgi:hypothetical protein